MRLVLIIIFSSLIFSCSDDFDNTNQTLECLGEVKPNFGLTLCEGDSTKSIAYCVDNELILMWLKSEEKDILLQLSISTRPKELVQVGDFLHILRNLGWY